MVKLIDKNHVLTSVADFSEANTASTASASGKTNTNSKIQHEIFAGRNHRLMLPDANVALKSSILWLRDHAILMRFLLIGSATA